MASLAGRSVDVIVPVHDGLEFVRDCLESVAKDLGANRRLIIVDDGSQPLTRDFCQSFAASAESATLVRRPEGSGFTRAANAGLRECAGDYQILLNSDTLVAPGWIEKLVRCAESAGDIGLVGPLSNAASWQSIPEIRDAQGKLAINELPAGMSVAGMDANCAIWARDLPYPRTSLLNGFCLAIKKEVREAIGLLDETNFSKGYGEENDFCLRAVDSGFGILVAIDTYVFHAKSKTYTQGRRRMLAKQGSRILRQLHGQDRVDRAVRSMQEHPVLVRMRELARNTLGHQP